MDAINVLAAVIIGIMVLAAAYGVHSSVIDKANESIQESRENSLETGRLDTNQQETSFTCGEKCLTQGKVQPYLQRL